MDPRPWAPSKCQTLGWINNNLPVGAASVASSGASVASIPKIPKPSGRDPETQNLSNRAASSASSEEDCRQLCLFLLRVPLLLAIPSECGAPNEGHEKQKMTAQVMSPGAAALKLQTKDWSPSERTPVPKPSTLFLRGENPRARDLNPKPLIPGPLLQDMLSRTDYLAKELSRHGGLAPAAEVFREIKPQSSKPRPRTLHPGPATAVMLQK